MRDNGQCHCRDATHAKIFATCVQIFANLRDRGIRLKWERLSTYGVMIKALRMAMLSATKRYPINKLNKNSRIGL